MVLLLTLRALTLCGWAACVAALVYLVGVRGQGLAPDVRRAWAVEAGRHGVAGLTTALIEVAWLLDAVAPGSALARLGDASYSPAFLFNGTIDAAVPPLMIGILLGRGVGRRVSFAVAGGAVIISLVAALLGAFTDWAVLMSASQLLSLLTTAGYLSFFVLVVAGRITKADAYLIGLLAVGALYYLVLPIQTAFFQMAGREGSQQIWLINQLLQVSMLAAELAITLALVNALARGRENRTGLAAV